MEIQYSPTKDLNIIQRNIKVPKNIKIKSKRYLKNYTNIKKDLKFKRTCK